MTDISNRKGICIMQLKNLKGKIGSSISPQADRYMQLEILKAQLLRHSPSCKSYTCQTTHFSVFNSLRYELKQQTQPPPRP